MRIDIRSIRMPSEKFSYELLKAEKAIKFADLRLIAGGGNDVQRYADGWSLSEVYVPKHGGAPQLISAETGAEVYEALEAKRFAQSSARFVAHAPEMPRCPECGLEGACHVVTSDAVPNYHAKAYISMKQLSLEYASEGGAYVERSGFALGSTRTSGSCGYHQGSTIS